MTGDLYLKKGGDAPAYIVQRTFSGQHTLSGQRLTTVIPLQRPGPWLGLMAPPFGDDVRQARVNRHDVCVAEDRDQSTCRGDSPSMSFAGKMGAQVFHGSGIFRFPNQIQSVQEGLLTAPRVRTGAQRSTIPTQGLSGRKASQPDFAIAIV
jgi:hypothetical protein